MSIKLETSKKNHNKYSCIIKEKKKIFKTQIVQIISRIIVYNKY